MTNETQPPPNAWRVVMRDGRGMRIEADFWESKDDGFFYFGNGGNGCAAAVSIKDVVSIVQESS